MKSLLSVVLSASLIAIPALTIAQAPAPVQPPAPATPAAAADTRINGKWKFTFDTAGGERDFDADFMVDAEGKVTGTWAGKPASGTYKDGHLVMSFETHSDEAGETATLQLDGKLDDTLTISGNWAFGEYDGAFKATHSTLSK